MSDQEQYVELQPEDPGWISQRLAGGTGPTRVVLRPGDDDQDVEGHAMGTTLRLQAFDEGDDTEGHAISVHFPSREAAADFRRRLLLTGALTGTLVLGAAGGYGLANITNDGSASGAATTAQSAAGMDWTQAERPGQAAAAGDAGSGAGMDWTQAERPGQAAGSGPDSADGQSPARGTSPVPE